MRCIHARGCEITKNDIRDVIEGHKCCNFGTTNCKRCPYNIVDGDCISVLQDDILYYLKKSESEPEAVISRAIGSIGKKADEAKKKMLLPSNDIFISLKDFVSLYDLNPDYTRRLAREQHFKGAVCQSNKKGWKIPVDSAIRFVKEKGLDPELLKLYKEEALEHA